MGSGGRKIKRILVALISLALALFGLTSLPAYAVADGTVNCSGGGTFTILNNEVTTQSSCVGTVVIPSGVTKIKIGSLSWQSTITRIEIPASVTTIGRDFTYNASGLTDIVVDAGNANYTTTDGVLFNKNSTNLIVYPIGKTAATYNIPSSVTALSDYAFAYTKLTSFTIPVAVTSIGYGVLYDSAVTTAIFTAGSTITTISSGAFTRSEALTSISIPGSVTSIEDWAFFSNPALVTVNFEAGVAPLTIGEYAFNSTGLTSIDIPARVSSIGNDAFLNAVSLTGFNVHADNANYASVDGVLFNKDLTTLKKYPRRKTSTSYVIPPTVTTIDRYAFYWANILTSVSIPASLASIGQLAFYDTPELTNITVDANNQNFASLDGVLFNKNLTTLLKYPARRNATSYVIPSTVTETDIYSFFDSDLLTEVTIPAGITTMGDATFYYSSALVDIYFLGNAPATVGWGAFNSIGGAPKAYIISGATGFGAINSSWQGLTVQLAPSTIPSAPTSLTATAGNGEAVISFTPGSDGGSAITNYKYSINGSTYTALSPTVTTSPITISGLTNGTTYSIYLKAVNTNGDSSASSAVSVTPAAPVVVSDEDSKPVGYFEPVKTVILSNQKLSWEPNEKVVISRYDSNTKRNILIENTSGQYVFPKAKPGQSVSYSVMATDGTVLKVVTMKSKPLVPKIANAFAQKSAVLTINKKMAINARWIKDRSHKKYVVKIKLDNGKSIIARTTDPNFSIITDETKGATITITAIGKNNLTSTVTRKI
jgi:hypothetical protein